MTASLAHFQGGIHTVAAEVILKLDQIFHRVGIVRVDRDPLATLVGGVDRIEANRDLPFQVVRDCFLVQLDGATRAAFRWAVIIMTATLRMRPEGLDRVSPAINEQIEVLFH